MNGRDGGFIHDTHRLNICLWLSHVCATKTVKNEKPILQNNKQGIFAEQKSKC